MKIITAFRNLDAHGSRRAPELIEAESAHLARRLERFPPELVRLEASLSQTRGKKRIRAGLRLQLPSGVIATQEEGFEVEPVLRRAFAELDRKLARHLSRLRREETWKRPARRARLEALLPPARDRVEAERRALWFDLVEDHIDALYNAVRRELAYLAASGEVPAGRLSLRGLVDATILKGLERFTERPAEFDLGDWLMRLAYETIEAEARAARRALPDDAASLEHAPEAPAEEPTEADQEMFEFYQPDDVPVLEDLVADTDAADPEAEALRHEAQLALHRAMAALPALWRRVLTLCDVEERRPEEAAAILGLSEAETARIAVAARDFLRQKLVEAGLADAAGPDQPRAPRAAPAPQPIAERERIERGLRGATGTGATAPVEERS